MNVLIDHDRVDLAYAIMAQHDLPSWGYWIDQGATTLWEDWRGNSSRDHVMYGDVSACMFKALAGIRRESPGFSRVSIRPGVVGDLTWANARYESVHGEIASSWKIEGNKLIVDVTIPQNVTATIFIPTRNPQSVTTRSGLPPIRFEAASAVFQVAAGKYHFESLR
jgi:alpha-L-rhamnosidase